MAKYTIDLPDKSDKYIRSLFEKDKKFWSTCKKGSVQTTENYEEYLVWVIEDFIAECKEVLESED